MPLKYLCYSYKDVQTLDNEEIELRVRSSGLDYPLAVVITADVGLPSLSSPELIKIMSVEEAENFDENYPLDVSDTQIVHLRSIADAKKLYEETASWSPLAFQDPSEFIKRPYFIVSCHTRLRWYKDGNVAKKIAPWAEIITIDQLPSENYLGSLAELLI